MPRAICRCGHTLSIPADPTERVVCPGCGARVRIRPKPAVLIEPAQASADGAIRFFCECGRRLKVSAAAPPPFGKCPDCGAVVPVPTTSLTTSRPAGHPESPTEDLPAADREAITRWSAGHKERTAAAAAVAPPPQPPAEAGVMATMAFTMPPTDKVEVGMRICAQCGQPIPLGAQNCRQCGAPVAKR